MLVGEGEAERRGVQLREEGAVGLPAETQEAVGGKVGAEWGGGGRGVATEHSGSANKTSVQAAVSGKPHVAGTWWRGVKIGGEGDSGASGGP